MPFRIVRDDITHVKADAIVNAANQHLWAGGGVCGAIFKAAGSRKLQEACDRIGHCDTGSAVATPGFALPARYVIHAVGPIWQGGTQGERELLESCYRSSLELAAELKCRSIAFPLISAGIYGYPRREALEVAQEQIRAFLDGHEMDVTLVLYDSNVMELADGLRLRVERYIDDVYVGEHAHERSRRNWELQQLQSLAKQDEETLGTSSASGDRPVDAMSAPEAAAPSSFCPHCGHPTPTDAVYCLHCGRPLQQGDLSKDDSCHYGASSRPNAHYVYEQAAPAPEGASPGRDRAKDRPMPTAAMPRRTSAGHAPRTHGHAAASAPAVSSEEERRHRRLPVSLRNLLTHMDAGFSETLLAMIDDRGLKDAQVYKRANLSRQHFSKIRSNPRYKPTKTTVLALAVALELSLEETTLLLERAGFALSHADRRDVIVEFFIREGIYDVFQINDALFAFDQPLLG